MDFKRILQELKAERDRLDNAINALEGMGSSSGRGRRAEVVRAGRRGGRRKMSAAARRKIAAAQRARWAKQKAEKKTS